MQTKRTEWVHVANRPEWAKGNSAAYRIWMQTDGRRFWQRHEWKNRDGSISLDDWINCPSSSFPSHYLDIPADELIAA